MMDAREYNRIWCGDVTAAWKVRPKRRSQKVDLKFILHRHLEPSLLTPCSSGPFFTALELSSNKVIIGAVVVV